MKKIIALFSFLIKYSKRNMIKIIVAVLGVIIIALFAIPLPYLSGYILDNIFIKKGDLLLFYKIIALMVVTYISKYLISKATKYLFLKISTNVVNEIRIAMLVKAMKLPMDFYDRNDKGYVLSRISESTNVGNIFSPSTINIFIGLFDFVFSIVAIFALNIKISLVVIGVMPFYFLIVLFSSKSFTKNIRNTMENNAIVSGEIFETLNNVEEIKILNIYDIQINKIKEKLSNLKKSIIKQDMSMIFLLTHLL